MPAGRARALLDWYDANKRDLPWRRTRDPYAVWVSEVMLQQTQAKTVVPYFERWMRKYPTIKALAEADEQEALAIWQGLGYYRRCRLLIQGAKWIVANGLPITKKRWEEAPGVGKYTASAIASIALEEPCAVVDGNVERVFARFAACRETGDKLLRQAREWADANLVRERPGDWNQALMELGAAVCTPRKPSCEPCPLSPDCLAVKRGVVDQLPVQVLAPETVRQECVVWVPFNEGAFGVRQIPEGQWWEGMWEFPRAEGGSSPDGEVAELRELVGPGWAERLKRFTHHVTHHRIAIDPWLIRAEERPEGLRWVSPEELKAIAMPSPQRKIAKMAAAQLGSV